MQNNRLFVGNLSFNTTEDDVRSAFQGFGDIVEVKLVTDRETGRSRGFAFVSMATDADAQRAMQEMNGQLLAGRPLRVNEAEAKGAGGGGRDGFGGFGARGAAGGGSRGGGAGGGYGGGRGGYGGGGGGRDGGRGGRGGNSW